MTTSSFTITPPVRSTIFLNDLTVIDHAYIDDNGCIVGGSFNPCFEVSGSPDPKEKVVVDFSTIKHDIKEMIDRHSFVFNKNGFDHKVWIVEGYSNVTLVRMEGNSNYSTVVIATPAMELTVPGDAVKMIPAVDGKTPHYSGRYIGAAFEEYLQPLLEEKYPNLGIKVKCTNTETFHIQSQALGKHAHRFRYVHGLKDSSSYGCNNIAHGHGSFITADADTELLRLIAAELDNTVFVRADNVANAGLRSMGANVLLVEYTTPRGLFRMTLDPSKHKIVILNTETTVEYLAEYVKTKFGGLMSAAGISKFYISEGLSKGAVETLVW